MKRYFGTEDKCSTPRCHLNTSSNYTPRCYMARTMVCAFCKVSFLRLGRDVIHTDCVFNGVHGFRLNGDKCTRSRVGCFRGRFGVLCACGRSYVGMGVGGGEGGIVDVAIYGCCELFGHFGYLLCTSVLSSTVEGTARYRVLYVNLQGWLL